MVPSVYLHNNLNETETDEDEPREIREHNAKQLINNKELNINIEINLLYFTLLDDMYKWPENLCASASIGRINPG